MSDHKKIYSKKFCLVLVFFATLTPSISFASALPNPNVFGAALPPTTDSKEQIQIEKSNQDKSSVLTKLKNSFKNIFSSSKPNIAISQEWEKDLASLIKRDKASNNSTDKGALGEVASLPADQANEPLIIPSLPADKDPENKLEEAKPEKNALKSLPSTDKVIIPKIENQTAMQNTEMANPVNSATQNSTINKANDQDSRAKIVAKPPIALSTNAAEIKQVAVVRKAKNATQDLVNESKVASQAALNEDLNKNLLLQEADKFITDETKLLLLPEDDVTLGKVSLEAAYENMDDYAYLNLFKAVENSQQQSINQHHIDDFIRFYEHEAAHRTYGLSLKQATAAAFAAARRNNLAELKMFLDNYAILQIKNSGGQNLLHLCVELENYSLSEFLIKRGININARDEHQNSAFSIALALENNNLISLLKKAGAK